MKKTTSLGQFLKEARLRAGFPKQEALADALGCRGQYIHLLETGKTIPSLTMSIKIERILRIDHNKLVGQVIEIKIRQKINEIIRECEELGIDLNHSAQHEVTRNLDVANHRILSKKNLAGL